MAHGRGPSSVGDASDPYGRGRAVDPDRDRAGLSSDPLSMKARAELATTCKGQPRLSGAQPPLPMSPVRRKDCDCVGARLGLLSGWCRCSSFVTQRKDDPAGVFRAIRPSEEAGTGLAPACWPDQKPVRPLGVTHHSPAVSGLIPRPAPELSPNLGWRSISDACRSAGLRRRRRFPP